MAASTWPALPPKGVDPGKLFRLLTTARRPRWQLSYRLPLAPDVPLSVRALRGVEVAEAHDVDIADPLVAASTIAARVVSLSLCCDDDGSLALRGPSQLHGLTRDELLELSSAVNAGLEVISPIYGLSDLAAWDGALRLGALQNPTASLMADCADVSVGMSGVYRNGRPDRYYGRPLAELTDAQLMAYSAAYAAVDAMRSHG